MAIQESEPEPQPPPVVHETRNGTPNSEEHNLIGLSFNIKDEDLIRGATPDDIESKCLQLCRTYIGGSWSNAKEAADVTVTRISGGLTNQLYRVHLNEHVSRVANLIYPNEPSDVAIKLYDKKHFNSNDLVDPNSERLNDNIVLTILSEQGIGPLVYGIFSGGVIMAFHEHEQFRAKYQQNSEKLRELATSLARIHHLSVPIHKTPFMLKSIESMIHYGYDKLQAGKLAKQMKLECLLAKDFRDEFRDLSRHIDEIASPVVFCHHDFRGGNILVTQPDQKIIVIDLEYAGYGPRGYDFGTFLTEWGKAQFSDQMNCLIPDDETIGELVGFYIDACNQLVPGYSSKSENSLEQIVREAKLFFLVQHMFYIAVCLKQETTLIPSLPYDPIRKMQFIELLYRHYNQIKKALFQNQTLKKLV